MCKLNFSENLKRMIDASGVKPAQLARHLGINKSTLHNYLLGSEPKSARTLLKLAAYFGVSIDELLSVEVQEGKPCPDFSGNKMR